MRRKIFLIVIMFFILLLLFYFLLYFFVIDSRHQNLLEVQRSLGTKNESYELIVSDFETDHCQITYCVFNNCNNVISLPCVKLEKNEFNGYGNYRLELNVGKHVLYPWGDKKVIKSWEVVDLNNTQQEKNLDAYVFSLKEMLSNYYLWQVYSIPISDSNLDFRNLYTLEQVSLDFDYTKSLYLLFLLVDNYEDQELKDIWQKEISYLNKNIDDILAHNQERTFPEAYLVKLVNLGLDEGYLILLENFEVSNSDVKQEVNYDNSQEAMLLNRELYSKNYKHIIRYVDYYKIFLEHDYYNLAQYSYNEAIRMYNSSQYSVYGICSLQYSIRGLIENSMLKNKLKDILTDSELNLIEGNIYELLMCKKFAEEEGINIIGLDSRITDILQNLSLNVDDKTVLVRGLSPTKDLDNEVYTIVTYNSLDNLMLLTNYEE